MSGQGDVQIAEPRVSLRLDGRRLDADSFILSANGQDFKSRFREWSIPKFMVPVDLDLKIDSIGLGQEDLSNAIAKLSFDRGMAKFAFSSSRRPGKRESPWREKRASDARSGTEGKSPCNPRHRIDLPAIWIG